MNVNWVVCWFEDPRIRIQGRASASRQTGKVSRSMGLKNVRQVFLGIAPLSRWVQDRWCNSPNADSRDAQICGKQFSSVDFLKEPKRNSVRSGFEINRIFRRLRVADCTTEVLQQSSAERRWDWSIYAAGTDELDGRELCQENLLQYKDSHTHFSLRLNHKHSRGRQYKHTRGKRENDTKGEKNTWTWRLVTSFWSNAPEIKDSKTHHYWNFCWEAFNSILDLVLKAREMSDRVTI